MLVAGQIGAQLDIKGSDFPAAPGQGKTQGRSKPGAEVEELEVGALLEDCSSSRRLPR
jgi:hypothetical protein